MNSSDQPWKDERLNQLWSHPVRLNLETLDWESNSTHHYTIAPLNVIFFIGKWFLYLFFVSESNKTPRHSEKGYARFVWISCLGITSIIMLTMICQPVVVSSSEVSYSEVTDSSHSSEASSSEEISKLSLIYLLILFSLKMYLHFCKNTCR